MSRVGNQPEPRRAKFRSLAGLRRALLAAPAARAGVGRLARERDFVAPRIVVALGATAVLSLAEKRLSIAAHRGPATLLGRAGYITVHPSAILRIPDRDDRRAARCAFVADLRHIKRLSVEKPRKRSAPIRQN